MVVLVNGVESLKMVELKSIMKGIKDNSLVSRDIVQQADKIIRKNSRFTISELSMKFPEISRSSLYYIVTKNFGYKKICTHWVPKMLTDNHKTQRMAATLAFLNHYNSDEKDFLKSIVTGDETWIQYDTPKTKHLSQQ